MRILVAGDTHGDVQGLKNVLKDTSDMIDAFVHTGDCETDALHIARQFPKLPVYGVCGNCDFGRIFPPVRMDEICGKRVFVTHGHRYDVNYSLMQLAYTAIENQADICLFGHTHIPLVERYDNLVIVNPGSLSRPRGGSKCSYAVIEIDEDGTVTPKIVEYQ